jgi:hypothetical protein
MIARRWRSGRRVMLLIRSMSTGLEVRSTGSRYSPAPRSPSGIWRSGGGVGAPGARGSVSEHSTYFSPMSDWGRIVHCASLRKSSKPGVLIEKTIAALLSAGDLELLDLADVDAADAHVLALDQRERVVEDHADLVVASVSPSSAPVPSTGRRRRPPSRLR